MQKTDPEARWVSDFRRERRAGTPLVALATPDVPEATRAIAEVANGKSPAVAWSCSQGFIGLNAGGEQAVAVMTGGMSPDAVTMMSDALILGRKMPERGILVMQAAHLHWSAPMTRDAMATLRDLFKQDGRTLALLAPDVADLPREVAGDTRILRETLPDAAARREVIESLYTDAAADPANKLPALAPAALDEAARATAGLSAFACEQAAAVAIGRDGLALGELRRTARETVNGTKGLRMEDPTLTFADVAGLGALERYTAGLFAGPSRPCAVILVDEVEKAVAGAGGGDLSGVSSDMLGALLTWMEQRQVLATLAMGPPGAGKSLMAQATAGTHKVPLIWMDIGAMKGSLVGESGANLRRALDTIDSVAEGRILLVGTCNSVEALRPELMRRFFPRFVVDLPDAATLPDIWRIQLAAHGLPADAQRPDATGWTGAEVRNACRLARDLGMTPAQAADYIVPVSVSSAETIRRVRQEATARFTCARYGGAYRGPDAPAPAQLPPTGKRPQRRINGN